MGRKYDFKDLLAAAVQRLTYEHPTTLEKYQQLIQDNPASYLSTRIEHYKGLLFDIVRFGREAGLFTILPCAYLRAILYNHPVRYFTLRFLHVLY